MSEMTCGECRLRALTLEERSALLQRLPLGMHGQADNGFDLFGSKKTAIAAETFKCYGITDPVKAVSFRAPLRILLEAAPSGRWLSDFESRYRDASLSQKPEFAPPALAVCDALWPIINAAIAGVRRFVRTRTKCAGFPIEEDQVLNDAAAKLYSELFLACARALVIELGTAHVKGVLRGATPEERFAFFVECLRDPRFSRKILEQYPVLLRQVMTLTNDWREACIEFFDRLIRDFGEISKRLFEGRDAGPLSRLELSAGDNHRRGRAVILAQFAAGRVVYKPKPRAIDRHFAEFVEWMNARAQDLSPAAPHNILDKGSYGWCAFITQRPCGRRSGIKEFYRRQGANLALLYLLGGCDFHSENLIAESDTPKLIDLEMLFHPILLSQKVSGATRRAHLGLSRSVLRTGLLPYRVKEPSSPDSIDLSGVGNVGYEETPFEIPVWEDTTTDQMRLVSRRTMTTPDQNLPIYRGKHVGPGGYTNEIVAGFNGTYQWLCAHKKELMAPKGPLEVFRGDRIRVVVRSTNRYALLLEESYHPEYLTDALAKEALFDSLWEEAADDQLLVALIPAERRDLWRGDIPYFSTRTDSVDLWTSTGMRVPNALEEPGLQAVFNRVADLNDRDLDHQTNLIRSALAVVKHQAHPAPPLRLRITQDAETPLEIAKRIGERLSETAVRESNRVNWIILSQTLSSHVACAPAGIDLYDGLPGIVLFLAYLGAVTGDHRFQDLARSAVAELLSALPLRDRAHLSGAFAGLGGVIYALAQLSRLLPESNCEVIGVELTNILWEELDAAEEVDVIGGLAGIILASNAAAGQTALSSYSRLASRAGDVLLGRLLNPQNEERQIFEGIKWPLSFAHGRAGIAYSLLKLYDSSRQERFKTAALEIIRDELAIVKSIDSADRAPTHAGAVALQIAWCHGKPGVALAMKAARMFTDMPGLESAIEAAVTSISSSPLERSDCICHGNFGNLLLLKELVDCDPGSSTCSAFSKKILRKISKQGLVCGNLGLETAGLMEGVSGIGLALLKLIRPQQVPNVLILEIPNESVSGPY